ncbi:GMC oxidoreductase [Bipolaris oryzae ATCC 44560]|uniref:GMC oxidoreductase n=1 Tax=Bipolaris oryzae ATCC 44560 TaxID=930090 RepID=W6Z6C2_COCMI|nr:GMC oxidoreductase [Bipolaris oryzae ATCC 44560]EUC45545.1 GMC oxidoreductase [Bipolaris oryzae ATCC 44560]
MRSFVTPSLFGLAVSVAVTNGTTYDYVIVGGGTTGLVVANRLSEDQNKTVLVIENGALSNSTLSSIPGNSGGLNLAAMYDIYSAPVPALGNQTFLVTVGNVVGGGSFVNGMQFDRGAEADYDAWTEPGNKGWDWKGLKPYFMKSNHFDAPSNVTIEYDAKAYGSGPLKVSILDDQFSDMKIEGFSEPVGHYWSPNSIDKATAARSTARTAYYDPIVSRKNLKLLTETHVDEITFSKDRAGVLRATGVKYTPKRTNEHAQVFASKEVILAAGGIFTPHLLMSSGIGPKDVLEAAGVTIKKDLPAVGSNFQDRIANYMNFDLQKLDPENKGALTTNATFNQTAYDSYSKSRTGPYSTGKSNGLMLLALQHFCPSFNTTLSKLHSQIPTHFLLSRYSTNPALLAGFAAQRAILATQFSLTTAAVGEIVIQPGSLSGIANNKPLSRGTITLSTTHPAAYPIVQWNTFQNLIDADIIVALTRYNRAHWASSPALSRYNPVETAPGPEYQTDEEIIAGSVRSESLQPSFAHPIGGCSMMPEELGGCVSDELRVYGVEGLSVVDASMIPMIPAAHLQATMYAVAEKAADLIKGRG